MKRLKKRKSAPVLNEICEENENETGDLSRLDLFRRGSDVKFQHRRKHTTSLCCPTERYASQFIRIKLNRVVVMGLFLL